MMYDDLIKSLRTCGKALEIAAFPEWDVSLYTRAADAIEELYLSGNNLVAVVDDMAEDLKKFCWIPVTERLPEIGQEVLVWSYGFINVYTLIQVDERVLRWRDNDGYYQINEDKEFWMPLPEPPESEGET